MQILKNRNHNAISSNLLQCFSIHKIAKIMNTLTLIQPDDWHCHLRDDLYLKRTVSDTARQFARAIVMPNLKPPITTIDQAREYQHRIEKNIPAGLHFQPLMTLYLTENFSPPIFQDAKKSGVIFAAKYYPMGATTHSDAGVSH